MELVAEKVKMTQDIEQVYTQTEKEADEELMKFLSDLEDLEKRGKILSYEKSEKSEKVYNVHQVNRKVFREKTQEFAAENCFFGKNQRLCSSWEHWRRPQLSPIKSSTHNKNLIK